MPTKVLLDTDIGTHIDDALCLTYLLAEPECELLGITTVTGQAMERAKIASAVCRHFGRDIPIHAGAEKPLLVPAQQLHAGQAQVLSRWPHQVDFPSLSAAEFLRQTIHQHPHEIVLLGIGPLTNLGLLFALDPEVADLLKGLVLMGGCFSSQLANVGPYELNIQLDPHAAAIVYQQSIALHRSVGIDVTCATALSAREFVDKLKGDRFAPARDFAEVWLRENEEIWFKSDERVTFHDPLAAAAIFHPEFCPFVRGKVEVELSPGRALSLTHFDPTPDGPHEVSGTVHPEAFFEYYFRVCS